MSYNFNAKTVYERLVVMRAPAAAEWHSNGDSRAHVWDAWDVLVEFCGIFDVPGETMGEAWAMFCERQAIHKGLFCNKTCHDEYHG
jgi:hypothetical protein